MLPKRDYLPIDAVGVALQRVLETQCPAVLLEVHLIELAASRLTYTLLRSILTIAGLWRSSAVQLMLLGTNEAAKSFVPRLVTLYTRTKIFQQR